MEILYNLVIILVFTIERVVCILYMVRGNKQNFLMKILRKIIVPTLSVLILISSLIITDDETKVIQPNEPVVTENPIVPVKANEIKEKSFYEENKNMILFGGLVAVIGSYYYFYVYIPAQEQSTTSASPVRGNPLPMGHPEAEQEW